MTEAEWATSDDPGRMLDFLSGRGSERKFRLFAAGCCRQMVIRDGRLPRGYDADEVAWVERLAEGGTLPATLHESHDLIGYVGAMTGLSVYPRAVRALHWALSTERMDAQVAGFVSEEAVEARVEAVGRHARKVRIAARKSQCHLLRDLFGDLFQPAAVVRPSRWGVAGDAVKLAQTIYEAGDFDRLPILADALEEAGCADEHILLHCRRGRWHARGCWVVDWVLGKR
jgi:hypothetical protein